MSAASPSPSACTCQLQYPERFYAAVLFYDSLIKGDLAALSDETKLVLYALRRQATDGRCTDPRPSRWNFVEHAKWQSWHHLASMSSFEAMHLYVRTIEQEFPRWWISVSESFDPSKFQAGALPASAKTENGLYTMGSASSTNSTTPLTTSASETIQADTSDTSPVSVSSASTMPPSFSSQACTDRQWAVLEVQKSTNLPNPRYEHAAAVLGTKLCIVGGIGPGSRHLNDVWVLDLLTLQWSNVSPRNPSTVPAATPSTPPSLPPCAGHTITHHQDRLILIGGRVHRKYAVDELQVRQLDTQTMCVQDAATSGWVPGARGGHTATRVNNCIYLFGGEDRGRKPLSDLQILDLSTMTWQQQPDPPPKKLVPPPRSAHIAAAYKDRYVLIFGGGAGASCHSDVWALDTKSLTWQELKIVGQKLAPRAGHAGWVERDTWYVVGGGNNMKGCADIVAIDLLGLAAAAEAAGEEGSSTRQPGPSVSWSQLDTLPARSPLASEGLSMSALQHNGSTYLLAFGGYNGEYHRTVSAMRLPAAADGHSATEVSSPLPPSTTVTDYRSLMPPSEVDELKVQVEEARRETAMARDAAVLLQRQIVCLKGELEEAEKKLAASQQRCSELEGMVASQQKPSTAPPSQKRSAPTTPTAVSRSASQNGNGVQLNGNHAPLSNAVSSAKTAVQNGEAQQDVVGVERSSSTGSIVSQDGSRMVSRGSAIWSFFGA